MAGDNWNLVYRNYIPETAGGGSKGAATPQHPTIFGIEIFKNMSDTSNTLNNGAVLWLSSTKIPDRKVNIGKVDWMNSEMHYVTRTVPAGEWECSFYVFEDMEAYKYMQDWYNQCVNIKAGTLGTMDKYKRRATVFLYDTTAQRRTMEFVMDGVIPDTIGGLSLDYSDDKVLTFNCSFSYESFDMKIGGQSTIPYRTR